MVLDIVIKVLVAIFSTAMISLLTFCWKKMKSYKKIIEQQEQKEMMCEVDKKVQPILDDLEELRDYVRRTAEKEDQDMRLIVSSYRYRLTQLCDIYLHRGYITVDEYDQLSEFYRIYTGLGGNGQAKERYEMVLQLERKHD